MAAAMIWVARSLEAMLLTWLREVEGGIGVGAGPMFLVLGRGGGVGIGFGRSMNVVGAGSKEKNGAVSVWLT